MSETTLSEATPEIEIRRSESRAMNKGARERFDAGLTAMESEDFAVAHAAFSEANRLAPDSARVQSYLGLATARANGDFTTARDLCERASKREFFNPDVYLNIALVYLAFDFRAEALRYLRRGKMIDPGHQAILAHIALLGRRRMPIVPFLPRRHPVNRALGEARAILSTRLVARRAA